MKPLGKRTKRKVRSAIQLLAGHHSFDQRQVPPQIWWQVGMTWFCQQCKQNNTEHQEYCRNCRAHWSKVWVKPKRRSRSKSAKATSYRDAGHQEPTEENVDWNVFPLKAPWIPTTPSSRVQGKKGETTVGAGSDVPSAQHVVQPAQVSNTDMALTAEEEKILENLKGLQEAGLEFSMDMQQKLEILVAKQAAGAKKPLTHGHLNRLNKVKSQLTNAAKRIEELDQEWSSFVQKTREKVKQHAAMYQSCRADLLEAYNSKLEELSMLKKEMTEASLSMLAPAVTVAPMEKSVDVEKQIHSLEEVIDIESVVGAVDLTDDMDDEVPMGGEALQPASVCPRIPSLFVGRHLQQR